MAGKGIIEHKGIVDHIESNTVYVKILAESACVSCKLNGVCGSDTKEKIIEVENVKEQFLIGEEVNVIISEKLGMKALFFGYILPFIVVVLTLIICSLLTKNEGLSGLISIASLGPYYLILSLFRDRLKKSFQFNLHKRMQ